MKIILILVSFIFHSLAVADTPASLRSRDVNKCESEAGSTLSWVMNSTRWRTTYNRCLQRRLARVGDIYHRNTMELIRLEQECFNGIVPMNETLTDLHMTNLNIVRQMPASEMDSSGASNRIESIMEDYYRMILANNQRIRRLRNRQSGQ